MAGERKTASFAIHAEDDDVVGALIAAVEELARGVEVEAARIISPRPFFSNKREVALRADGKDSDAVVQQWKLVIEATMFVTYAVVELWTGVKTGGNDPCGVYTRVSGCDPLASLTVEAL
jgi:hypothetical protein